MPSFVRKYLAELPTSILIERLAWAIVWIAVLALGSSATFGAVREPFLVLFAGTAMLFAIEGIRRARRARAGRTPST